MKSELLQKKEKTISILLALELVIIVFFALVPLFFNLPYRINIFLAWEGAYRMSLGQMPFKDFGLPLGYAFWLIPALFFKIFGPYLITLVKAQVFINVLSGIVFSALLKTLGVRPAHKLIAVLLFVISYSFINFWPWYNHMVFFYQLLSLYFLALLLLKYPKGTKHYIFIFLSTLFLFFSVFTKQDGGAFALSITFFILLYFSIVKKSIKVSLTYILSLLIISIIFIVPLLQYDFGYWFNYGQEPHSSRLFLIDFLNDIFGSSQWIKFYLLIIAILLLKEVNSISTFFKDEKRFIFFLITIGILVQATLVQVTSYIPDTVNIYFHSFALAYILTLVDPKGIFEKKYYLIVLSLLLVFWWSGDFWKYSQRILSRISPDLFTTEKENVISKNTWRLADDDSTKPPREAWTTIDGMPSFKKILMPPSTVAGIKKLKELDIDFSNARVLNMSELTPLSYELGFTPETGTQVPLWYHKDVAFFDREIQMYCSKIEEEYYDLVLFESIDHLNNFYPDAVKECLDNNYMMIDQFLAPREIQDAYIHVYIRKERN